MLMQRGTFIFQEQPGAIIKRDLLFRLIGLQHGTASNIKAGTDQVMPALGWEAVKWDVAPTVNAFYLGYAMDHCDSNISFL